MTDEAPSQRIVALALYSLTIGFVLRAAAFPSLPDSEGLVGLGE